MHHSSGVKNSTVAITDLKSQPENRMPFKNNLLPRNKKYASATIQ
ncbi:hypothetical protein EC2729250_0820 [Escherichia coli 2729250]|nr:hypothetical protein EC2860050_4891 [Escherichia coli 2860050]EMW46040.1 hypothetical protein EC2770900_4773 [Escherichia coli 2770900]EMW70352.1 hypothetical protein EC2749250_0866 [Escherichia coli 2749250]EMX70090.1 hypothetical protein ECENVIRA101_2096 [Escherichia coli Envira 10/1]EMX72395.1 hypothetical protein ECENVIRA811_2017 [Escherichia coli Envira 8/11]EMZ79095.1 hypothetical protein ECP03052931_5284 [Escherichia coli p0305293.1]ENA55171.1 hypothetical protein EC2729250_0820 [Es